MDKLVNSVAVITGAADGIGKAIALRAAKEGMRIALADINAALLEKTVEEVKQHSTDVFGVCTDVSNANAVDAFAAEVFYRYGNVHLLINNAGVALAKPVWETTPQDWSWIMGVNLYGVTNCLRAFIPTMLKNDEEGNIINTASMAGLLSQPGLAAYCASKHAVVTVTEGLQYDLKLRKSKINAAVLCPLWVKTKIAKSGDHRLNATGQNLHSVDPVSIKIESYINEAIENGVSAEEVANEVFSALVDNRFYILTDQQVLPKIQNRMEGILSQQLPKFFPWR